MTDYALTGGCRERHAHPGVGPCDVRGAVGGAHEVHEAWHRIPGTLAVIRIRWKQSQTDPAVARTGGVCVRRVPDPRQPGMTPLETLQTPSTRCSLPTGHDGACRAATPLEAAPAFRTGDLVVLRRGVWDALVKTVWTRMALMAVLEGQNDPRSSAAYAEGNNHGWPLKFRSGQVVYDPGNGGALVMVRHDTGQELGWRRELLLPVGVEEPVRDRWEDDDGDYRDRLVDGREVR